MIYVGIDPGLDGAISAMSHDGDILGMWDTPTITIDKREKRNDGSPKQNRLVDTNELWEIMQRIRQLEGRVYAALEQVGPMPKQGVSSMFKMGRVLGCTEMALTAAQIPFEFVLPRRWKDQMLSGTCKDKRASLVVARRLFPGAPLARMKDDGRAEALLIADHIRRRMEASCPSPSNKS